VTAAQTKMRSITLDLINDAAVGFVRDNEHFASLWDYAAMGPKTGRKRRQLILLFCAQGFKRSELVSILNRSDNVRYRWLIANNDDPPGGGLSKPFVDFAYVNVIHR
jgi:hypothetical protein